MSTVSKRVDTSLHLGNDKYNQAMKTWFTGCFLISALRADGIFYFFFFLPLQPILSSPFYDHTNSTGCIPMTPDSSQAKINCEGSPESLFVSVYVSPDPLRHPPWKTFVFA